MFELSRKNITGTDCRRDSGGKPGASSSEGRDAGSAQATG